MPGSIAHASLLATIALLACSSWLPANDAASAGQGKGGEVIAKPTPTPTTKKTTAKKRTPARNSRTSRPAKSISDSAAAAEMIFWNSIKDSTNPDDFKEYLKKYPDGEYAGLAANRLKTLEGTNSSANPNQANPGSTNPSPTSPDTSSPANTKPLGPSSGAAETAEDADKHWKKAEALANERKYSEAEGEYRQAVRLVPNDIGKHFSFGVFLESHMRKFDAAEAEYRSSLPLGYQDLGHLLEHEHRLAEAEAMYRQVLKGSTQDEQAGVRWDLGNCLQLEGRWTEAQAEFKEAMRLSLIINKRLTDTSANPRAAAVGEASYHFLYAVLLERAEKYVEAEAEMREAVRLDPADSNKRSNLAGILKSQKKWPEAEAEIRELIRQAPQNSVYGARLADLLTEQNKLAEAESELRENIRLFRSTSDEGPTHLQFGSWLSGQKRWAEAESEFRETLRLAQGRSGSINIPFYHQRIGDALAGQNKFSEAEPEYRRAISESNYPSDVDHIALASCLDRENKLAEAEAEYKAAVQYDPYEATNHAELGDFFMRHKRWKEAAAAYKEAVRLEPKETKYQEKLLEATKPQK